MLVDGTPAKPSTPLVAGQRVVVEGDPPPEEPPLEPEDGPLRVLWEDGHLAVVDKPADLVVHPGAGRETGTLAHRLLHRWPEIARVGHPRRPGIVHRLDLDTTGALVVARTEAASLGLSAAFADRRVDKTYVAVAWGTLDGPRTVDLPIARHPTDRKKMAVVDHGRAAVTHLRPGARANGLTWLEVGLETGRTHQIRVHCKAIGHPLVGDPVYGEARWRAVHGAARRRLAEFPRPALHAARLGFDHPVTGERIVVVAPVPDDLCDLWMDVAGIPPPSD